jgi:hypothetical protein
MGRAYSMNGEMRNAYRILVEKPEGKRPLGDQDIGGWTILKWIIILSTYGLNLERRILDKILYEVYSSDIPTTVSFITLPSTD